MKHQECYTKVRYSLSDESGVVRFKTFNIVDAPECRRLTRTLQEYLIGRALTDVDLACVQQLTCEEHGECMRSVIRVIEECRLLFA